MHKISGINPKPFFFIYGFFLKNQNSQYVGIDVRPQYKGVGVDHLICWQEKNPSNYK
jgi:hypothetical protein